MATGTVLVTGASTGIGEATVLHLRELGFDPIAAVRKDEDAERLEGQGLRTTRIDVTDADQIAAARDALGDEPLAGLVNNAGIGVAAPLEFLPIDRLRQQLEINLIGQAAVIAGVPPRPAPRARQDRERELDRRAGGATTGGRIQRVEVRARGSERLAATRAAPPGRRRDPHRARWREDADLDEERAARR